MIKDRELILQFLKSQPMATVSTIKPGASQPESALVAFAQTDDLCLIFETFVDTRKWNNLRANPHVAFVIGWDTTKYLTVQYEGVAMPVVDDEIEKYTQLFIAKDTPCTENFLRDPRVRLFTVKPTWIRYSDYTGAIPRIIEKVFS